MYLPERLEKLVTFAVDNKCDLVWHPFWMENPDQLPANYREQIGPESHPRVICDYIAGMTDNFILEQHRQIFDSSEL